MAVGAIPGSVLGAQCSDRVGRRAAILAIGILNVIGWMLIFIAQYTETPSSFKSFLLLGRFWTGVCIGASASTVPVRFSANPDVTPTLPFYSFIIGVHS